MACERVVIGIMIVPFNYSSINFNFIRMKNYLVRLFLNFKNNRSGQSLTEYALILAVIALVAVAAVKLLGAEISSVFGKVKDALK